LALSSVVLAITAPIAYFIHEQLGYPLTGGTSLKEYSRRKHVARLAQGVGLNPPRLGAGQIKGAFRGRRMRVEVPPGSYAMIVMRTKPGMPQVVISLSVGGSDGAVPGFQIEDTTGLFDPKALDDHTWGALRNLLRRSGDATIELRNDELRFGPLPPAKLAKRGSEIMGALHETLCALEPMPFTLNPWAVCAHSCSS
jgi:hypothetical protein